MHTWLLSSCDKSNLPEWTCNPRPASSLNGWQLLPNKMFTLKSLLCSLRLRLTLQRLRQQQLRPRSACRRWHLKPLQHRSSGMPSGWSNPPRRPRQLTKSRWLSSRSGCSNCTRKCWKPRLLSSKASWPGSRSASNFWPRRKPRLNKLDAMQQLQCSNLQWPLLSSKYHRCREPSGLVTRLCSISSIAPSR